MRKSDDAALVIYALTVARSYNQRRLIQHAIAADKCRRKCIVEARHLSVVGRVDSEEQSQPTTRRILADC
jgi:hypothetical protein